MSPVPPPHVSLGPQGPQQDDFHPHPHTAPHPSHPPVFVIINPSPPQQQQQQAAMTPAPPSVAPPPPVVRPPPPPIIIKEENLPSEAELLEMVSLERRQAEEVRGGDRHHVLLQETFSCCSNYRDSCAPPSRSLGWSAALENQNLPSPSQRARLPPAWSPGSEFSRQQEREDQRGSARTR